MGFPDPIVSARFPAHLRDRLDELARFHRTNRAYLVRLCCQALLLPDGRAHALVNVMRDAVDRRKR